MQTSSYGQFEHDHSEISLSMREHGVRTSHFPEALVTILTFTSDHQELLLPCPSSTGGGGDSFTKQCLTPGYASACHLKNRGNPVQVMCHVEKKIGWKEWCYMQ